MPQAVQHAAQKVHSVIANAVVLYVKQPVFAEQ